MLPSAEEAWHGVVPFYEQAPLDLRRFHADVARGLEADADLAGRLGEVGGRLSSFAVGARLDASHCRGLTESWTSLASETSGADYEVLVRALLTIAKVKPIWKGIVPGPGEGHALPDETFRDQLGLRVARQISGLGPAEHPLAGFFAWLKPRR